MCANHYDIHSLSTNLHSNPLPTKYGTWYKQVNCTAATKTDEHVQVGYYSKKPNIVTAMSKLENNVKIEG